MDWLSKYNANIDCKKKRVIFPPSEEYQFVFIGTPSKTRMPMIFVMQIEKLLKNSCIGYLAGVINASKEQNVKPEDVPIFRDFLEVFP